MTATSTGDAQTWVLFVACDLAQGWTWAKKRLAFCELMQDGEDEGCLRLHSLPKPAQAAVIRDVLGIQKKRRELSAAELERLNAGPVARRVFEPSDAQTRPPRYPY
jgi:hypothetical protein